ncbi:MAG: hypothetical protein NW226_24995 [Microscillaceae bacterium]|nr:hypothetical protein [Microscillaceae bacterium]
MDYETMGYGLKTRQAQCRQHSKKTMSSFTYGGGTFYELPVFFI